MGVLTKVTLLSAWPGAREGQEVTEGVKAGLAGSWRGADESPPLPGTSMDTRQMTEKRFTIWPVLFPIKVWTLVNMQG